MAGWVRGTIFWVSLVINFSTGIFPKVEPPRGGGGVRSAYPPLCGGRVEWPPPPGVGVSPILGAKHPKPKIFEI